MSDHGTGPGEAEETEPPRVDLTTPEGLIGETEEGGQELLARTRTTTDELAREKGSVLRVPETMPGDPAHVDLEVPDDETMIINFGPQHPSTHGVLRLMMELDGETVIRSKPVIGYLHTGMEKTGEELTYQQGATNVTRMDYLSPRGFQPIPSASRT